MALTPAEKQRRYRARLRERLANADNAFHPDDLAFLRDEWHAKQIALEREIDELRHQLRIALDALEIARGQRKP
ncbi:MAG TPA: hypothetical protein VMN43_04025 [Aestuariivirgaceae bacterium]|nr:hypothetical protein [Aestuariivirgaceae bacterium]